MLFSGGLDSILTVRALQRQGIECILLNVATPFHDCSLHAAERAAALGAELVVHRTGEDYLRLIANPQWGYGKAINPCIDCRILMCRVAKQLMEERGAVLVATGEVAGQRPNSQKQHQLSLISRESHLAGRLVRPLSAKVLAETVPEREGMVDRERLFAFNGRGRVGLIRLARELGVKKIPQPSTGCLLCEKSYAPKLRDLFKYEPQPRVWDIDVLHAGRQLRIDPEIKCAIGRNEAQCDRLQELFHREDRRPSILSVPENFNGPVVLLIGPDSKRDAPEKWDAALRLAGSLQLRFTPKSKYDPENAVSRFLQCSAENLNAPQPGEASAKPEEAADPRENGASIGSTFPWRPHHAGEERCARVFADPDVEKYRVIADR